jgi:thioredoxin reductase
MELPDMPFSEWREKYSSEQARSLGVKFGLLSNRATAAEVRHYYSDYVDAKGLRSNFVNHATVTSVERVCDSSGLSNTDCESGEEDGDCEPCFDAKSSVWEVRGYRLKLDDGSQKVKREDFCYRAPAVVLATGLFDKPNVLRVRGENQPYVLHSLAELDDRILRGDIGPHSDPVVVVGAGLSAADAILRARAVGVPVAHVFRHNGGDPLATFRQLPPSLYPDYDTVHRLMRSEIVCDRYRCYPMASVVEFTSSREVLLQCESVECEVAVRASCVVVLIGSRPDLSFLQGDERQIGVVPGVAVDGKHNPVDVDPITYHSYRCPGLYAIGPLVGDSFVRFLRGGAVGVAANLWSERTKPEKVDFVVRQN